MSNMNDAQYVEYLRVLSARFRERTAGQPVFTTDANKERMWSKYVSSFDNPQYHNCQACHSFINHYAGLVVVDPQGLTVSAMWDVDDVPGSDRETRDAVRWLRGYAEDAKITGVFYSDKISLGHGVAGGWRHLHLLNPSVWVPSAPMVTKPGQAKSRKAEDYKSVSQALRDLTPKVLETALKIVESKAVYKASDYAGSVRWLMQLQEKLADAPQLLRANVMWREVAIAPDAYTHIRSSLIGMLLRDIKNGLDFDSIKARFEAAADPSNFQRKQKAPTVNQVQLAEKAVAEMGIAGAFQRRYTTADDIDVDGIVWQNTLAEPPTLRPQKAAPATGSVFAGLAPAKAAPAEPNVEVPPRTMTWEKFAREVLPGAAYIQYRAPLVGRFAALTTAADPEAPPIVAWDYPERRNPVAWSFPYPPARAKEWNLEPGSLVRVNSIVRPPNQWRVDTGHGAEGVFLLLDDAKDLRALPGGGLFVEHLKAELKPYRAVIEAHLNRSVVEGADASNVRAFGVGLLAGNDWTESAAPTAAKATASPQGKAPDYLSVYLVIDDSGSMGSYLNAARQALTELLEGIKRMPAARIEVTPVFFGSAVSIGDRITNMERVNNLVNNMLARSGNTALNDAIGFSLQHAADFPIQPGRVDTAYFLGIVTDGEENASKHHSASLLRQRIERLMAAGNWTVTYAGATHRPDRATAYARSIGVPEGNIKLFDPSDRGFRDVGAAYASSTAELARGYARGERETKTFFAAATGSKAIGTDYPVLVVTTKSGTQQAYKLDRWE